MMTPERIAELRVKQREGLSAPTWILKECLDEIERLNAENNRLQSELEAHAFEISRPMLIAKNEQLAKELDQFKNPSCPTKPPIPTD